MAISLRTCLPLAMLLAATGTALAQQRDPARPDNNAAEPAQRPEVRRPGQRSPEAAPADRARPDAAARAGSPLDTHIANCVWLGNQEEIALSRWALERTQNPQVRQFAQQMIEDHTKFAQELQPFASLDSGAAAPPAAQPLPGAAARNPAAPQRESASPQRDADDARASQAASDDRPNADASNPQQGTSRRVEALEQPQGMGSQMLALEKRISAECLQLTQQDLAKYQGHEFDMAFIGTQIAMHNGMLAKLKGSEEFASGEFQALLQKGAQTTMHHKQMAEQIQSQVAAAGGANQPGDAARTPARPGAQPAAPTPGGAANPPRSR